MQETLPKELQARRILNFAFKRKNQILAFAIATVLVVAGATFWVTAQYEAVAQILVTLGRGGLLFPTMGDQVPQVFLDQENIVNSEVEILKSASIAKRVIEETGGVGAVFPDIFDRGVVDVIARTAPAARGEPQEMQQALVRFQKDLNVQVVRKSNLINVGFQHPDPRVSAEVVNRLTAAYLDHRASLRKAKRSHEFFQSQAEVLDGKLRVSEKEMESLKEKHQIFNLEEQKNILLRQKSELQGFLNQATSSEIESTSRAAELRRKLESIPQSIPQAKQDDYNQLLISNLQSRLVELELQEKNLSERYTEGNRNLVSVREEIRMLRGKLTEHEGKQYIRSTSGSNPVYQNAQQDYIRFEAERRAQAGRRDILVKQLAASEDKLAELARVELRYNQLRSQVDADRRNYDLYQLKLEESRISEAMDNEKISNVSVVESALPPLKPVSPKPLLNLALAVVVGFFGGLFVAGLQELLSDRMEDPEDVERYLQMPVLTSVPHFRKA